MRDKEHIYIDTGSQPGSWRVHNSPTPDFEVAGTIHAASVTIELPDGTEMSLYDLVTGYQELVEANAGASL